MVDHRLHHHVVHAAAALRFDDLVHLIHGAPHDDGAGAVLSGVQRLDALRSVELERRDEVDSVDVGGGERILQAGKAALNAEVIAHRLQLFGIDVADGDFTDIGVVLVQLDKRRPKLQADYCNADLLSAHEAASLLLLLIGWNPLKP